VNRTREPDVGSAKPSQGCDELSQSRRLRTGSQHGFTGEKPIWNWDLVLNTGYHGKIIRVCC
jgi:hypothetical protein